MRTALLALALSACAERLPPEDCVPRFLDTPAGVLRPLAPMTAAVVSARRPIVRWLRRDVPADRCVRVEFCRDRDCRQAISHTDLVGDRAAPPQDLPAGVVFWRVRGEGAVSPTWYFYVPRGARPAVDERAIELREQFDVDGDGLGDLIHQQGFIDRQIPRADPAAPPRFERWGQIDTNSSKPTLNAGDLDGDGYLDIVVVHAGPGSARQEIIVYRGPIPRGDLPEALHMDVSRLTGAATPAPGLSRTVHGDFNGDGYSDLAVGTAIPTGSPAVYLLAGGVPLADALRQPRQTLRNVAVNGELHHAIAAHDVDGDGRVDLVTGANDANGGSGYVAIHRGLVEVGGALVEAVPHWDLYGQGAIRLGYAGAIADLTGDGAPELVLAAPTEGAGCVHVHPVVNGLPARVARLVRCAVARTGGGNFGDTLDAADLDGDGFDDLAAGGGISAPYTAVIRGVREGLSDGISYRDTPPGGREFAWVHVAFVSATDHADVVVLTNGSERSSPHVYPGASTSPLPEP